MEYVNVSTTQNIDLQYKIASVGDRILAYLFDSLIMIAWMLICFFAFVEPSGPQFWHLVFYVPVVFYNLLCEVFLNGQSFGKMVLKIKVAKLDGSELTFASCLIRWVMRLVDISLFSGLVAFVCVLINGKGQRLGDLAAGTTVIKLDTTDHFESTTFVNVPEDYETKYSEAVNLSDEDARVIKEVLVFVDRDNRNKGEVRDYHPMLLKTQNAIKTKLGIKEVKGTAKQFLEDLLKDFNHNHK
ncbi:RDD family protein [Labilibacter sediminis]|nr:RDD family protein [Labilibacter sediminis]